MTTCAEWVRRAVKVTIPGCYTTTTQDRWGRCRRTALEGSDLCRQHLEQAEATAAVVAARRARRAAR